jgi:hypothetical protein
MLWVRSHAKDRSTRRQMCASHRRGAGGVLGTEAVVGHTTGQRPDTVALRAGVEFAGPDLWQRSRVPRRFAVALLALGLVVPLLAPSRSSAFSLVVGREVKAGDLQLNHRRHDQVPPQLTAAASSRARVHPRTDDASVLVVLILALNSAVMLIRVASSPPSWMKH